MQIRPDRGWIKTGLAVLVAGVLGGGVMAATDIGAPGRKEVTADGVTGKGLPAPAASALDLAAAPERAEEAPVADPVVGDKIAVGSDGGSVTVSAVEDNVSAGRLFGAGEGRKYIAVEVKGCSGPHEKNLTFEPAYFLLRLDDGTMHDSGPGAKKPSLDGGAVPAGKCLSGWVTFTVKEGALATAVIYDGSRRLTWTAPPPKGAKPTTTTTAKPGAQSVPSEDGDTTSTTKPKTTATTAKPTPTTARSTATTAKPTTSSTKPATTSTTSKSASATTTTTSGTKGSTTSTSRPAKSSTTTTTAPSVISAPTDQDG